MDPASHRDDVDALAATLRLQMLDETLTPDGDLALDDPAAAMALAVEREAGVLDVATRTAVAERMAIQALGLGPLEGPLADPEVDEILVSGTGPVWVERSGRLT